MEAVGRWLALDYGEKRVGVAVSDALGLMAHPLPFIPNSPSLVSGIQHLIDHYGAVGVLVGVPITLSGSDSQQTQLVRTFIDHLGHSLSIPVRGLDERLSTVAATKGLAHLNGKQRRQKVDSESAAFVLQGFLDSQSHYRSEGS